MTARSKMVPINLLDHINDSHEDWCKIMIEYLGQHLGDMHDGSKITTEEVEPEREIDFDFSEDIEGLTPKIIPTVEDVRAKDNAFGIVLTDSLLNDEEEWGF